MATETTRDAQGRARIRVTDLDVVLSVERLPPGIHVTIEWGDATLSALLDPAGARVLRDALSDALAESPEPDSSGDPRSP